MVFIWRGAGIIAPIFFGISLWVCSYWYDDLRIGNWDYTGWAMFWAGIVNLLAGAILKFGFSDVDDMKREPGEVMPTKRRHDFFWIPVWIWGIILIAWGIYLFSGDDTAFTDDDDDEYVYEPEVEYEGERKVWLYNPAYETVQIDINNASGENYVSDSIDYLEYKYCNLDAGMYNFKHDGGEEDIEVLGSLQIDSINYDQAWYVIGGEYDLIMLYVNDACAEINRSELREIDWKEKVMKRYSGDSYLLPTLKPKGDYYYSVYGPGKTLPIRVQENEKVYSLIPIHEDLEITEEFLDSMVIEACV